jgi:hypothetical protein
MRLSSSEFESNIHSNPERRYEEENLFRADPAKSLGFGVPDFQLR